MSIRWCVQSLVGVFATVVVVGTVFSAGKSDVLLVPQDFPDIQAAVDAAQDGDVIHVTSDYRGAGAVVYKSVEINGNKTVIDEGLFSPAGPAAFLIMADGVTITNFVIEGGDTLHIGVLSGWAGDLMPHDDIGVTHNTFRNLYMSIQLWGGAGYEITHNTVESIRNEGETWGAAIDLSSYFGPVEDGIVAFNRIFSVWDGSTMLTHVGISLQSFDHSIENMEVVHNRVTVVGSTGTWDSTAMQLLNLGAVDATVANCYVAFNDLRGSPIPIVNMSTGENTFEHNRCDPGLTCIVVPE